MLDVRKIWLGIVEGGNSEEGRGSTRTEARDPLRSFYGPSFDEEVETTDQHSYSDTSHFISQLNTHTHWYLVQRHNTYLYAYTFIITLATTKPFVSLMLNFQ
jgi:hypothetical protein